MKTFFLNKQINDARQNYNYFFIKLIFSILQIIFKLSIILLISTVANYTIINIFAIIYTLYALYRTSYVINYYMSIIKNIKDTLKDSDLTFEIDLNRVSGSIIKGVVKYGK